MEKEKERTNTVLVVKNVSSAVGVTIKSGKPEKENKNGETRSR